MFFAQESQDGVFAFADRRVASREQGAMEPQVTIQIVGWNSAGHLPACLAALRPVPAGAAVVRYLDNGSRDDSVALVRRLLPAAEVVELSTNRGFAGAHNAGLVRCTTPYVLVLNPDVRLCWPSIPKLLGLFGDETVAAVQGKLYRDDAQRVLDSAGIVMTAALNGRDRGAGEVDRGQYDAPAELAAVTGAAGLYRLAALREVAHDGIEIFDEDFFAYKEDVDLGWRLRRAGWKIFYRPVAEAVHLRALGAGTPRQWSWRPRRLRARLRDQRTWYSLRNWVWMLCKNASLRDLIRHEVFVDARLLFFLALSAVYWPLLRVWPAMVRGLPRMAAKRDQRG